MQLLSLLPLLLVVATGSMLGMNKAHRPTPQQSHAQRASEDTTQKQDAELLQQAIDLYESQSYEAAYTRFLTLARVGKDADIVMQAIQHIGLIHLAGYGNTNNINIQNVAHKAFAYVADQASDDTTKKWAFEQICALEQQLEKCTAEPIKGANDYIPRRILIQVQITKARMLRMGLGTLADKNEAQAIVLNLMKQIDDPNHAVGLYDPCTYAAIHTEIGELASHPIIKKQRFEYALHCAPLDVAAQCAYNLATLHFNFADNTFNNMDATQNHTMALNYYNEATRHVTSIVSRNSTQSTHALPYERGHSNNLAHQIFTPATQALTHYNLGWLYAHPDIPCRNLQKAEMHYLDATRQNVNIEAQARAHYALGHLYTSKEGLDKPNKALIHFSKVPTSLYTEWFVSRLKMSEIYRDSDNRDRQLQALRNIVLINMKNIPGKRDKYGKYYASEDFPDSFTIVDVRKQAQKTLSDLLKISRKDFYRERYAHADSDEYNNTEDDALRIPQKLQGAWSKGRPVYQASPRELTAAEEAQIQEMAGTQQLLGQQREPNESKGGNDHA